MTCFSFVDATMQLPFWCISTSVEHIVMQASSSLACFLAELTASRAKGRAGIMNAGRAQTRHSLIWSLFWFWPGAVVAGFKVVSSLTSFRASCIVEMAISKPAAAHAEQAKEDVRCPVLPMAFFVCHNESSAPRMVLPRSLVCGLPRSNLTALKILGHDRI